MVRSISDKYESSYLVCVDRELVDHAKARKLMATLSQL